MHSKTSILSLHDALPISIALVITTAISVALVVAGVLVSNMARETQEIYLERVEVMIQLDEEISNSDQDRKSTRLNYSHVAISYAVFCSEKKEQNQKAAKL